VSPVDDNGTPRLSLPIREYIDREIERAIVHQREISDFRFVTIEESRRLAKIEQDRRLDQMNEFREENRKLTNTFVTRELHDKDLNAIRERYEPFVLAEVGGVGERTGSRNVRELFFPNIPTVVSTIVAVFALLVALWVGLHP
jgi:hypothetical protein